MGARLGERFHVIAPSLRGHGDSDRVGAGGYYHPPDYVADVASLVDAMARPTLSVVGHSMGGSVAAYFAGSYPARVERVALLEGLGPPEHLLASPERMVAWIASWRAARARVPKGYATLDEAALRLRQTDPLLSAERAHRLATHGTRRDADGRWRFKHDPLHVTSGPSGFEVATAARFWRAIACPCLHVDGDGSSMQHPPEEAARRRAFFPNPQHVVLPGAGHMMQWHQPAALSDLLIRFLNHGDS